MIIIDDQLFLRVLQGDNPFPLELRRDRRYSLRTTYAYQFRVLHAASKDAPEGVLSTLVHTATAEDVDVLRRRIRRPEPLVRVLDPLESIAAAIEVKQLYPLSQLLAELLGAAIFHDAAVALSVEPRNFSTTCSELGIPLLLFPSK